MTGLSPPETPGGSRTFHMKPQAGNPSMARQCPTLAQEIPPTPPNTPTPRTPTEHPKPHQIERQEHTQDATARERSRSENRGPTGRTNMARRKTHSASNSQRTRGQERGGSGRRGRRGAHWVRGAQDQRTRARRGRETYVVRARRVGSRPWRVSAGERAATAGRSGVPRESPREGGPFAGPVRSARTRSLRPSTVRLPRGRAGHARTRCSRTAPGGRTRAQRVGQTWRGAGRTTSGTH